MLTLQNRKILARLILAAFILMATYVTITMHEEDGQTVTSLPPLLDFLIRLDLIRVIGHFLTFGSVGFLLGSQDKHDRLAWQHIIAGGVITEIVQAVLGNKGIGIPLFAGIFYDLVINTIGGYTGIWLTRRQKSLPE